MVTAAENLDAMLDRCDKCGGRATFTLELDNGDLKFCEHHRRAYGYDEDTR